MENKNNQENALSLAVVQLFSQLYLMAYHSIILKPRKILAIQCYEEKCQSNYEMKLSYQAVEYCEH